MALPFTFSTTSRGMFWMLASGLCFVFMTVTVRYVGTRVPAVEAAFIRYVFGIVFLLPVIFQILNGSTRVGRWGLLTVRGILHAIGVTLWFFAMARVPIAEVTALSYLSPVLMTIGAALFFGERLYSRRILAIAFGLLGVFVILRPGFSTVSIGQIAQLCTAPLFAASMLMTKRLAETEKITVIVASLTIICALALLPGAVAYWVQPTATEYALLALTALLATAGHFTLTHALSLAPVAVLQPVSFLQLLWATLLGIALFNESIDAFVLLGGFILIGSTTYIAHRESLARKADNEHS